MTNKVSGVKVVQMAVGVLTLLLIGWIVMFRPSVVFSPSARVVLYLLVGTMPAILFAGATERSDVKFTWGSFSARAGGAFGVVIIVIVVLSYLSKPEAQIASFRIVDGPTELSLEAKGVVRVTGDSSSLGFDPRACVSGDQLLMIFPEQLESATVTVRHPGTGEVYQGQIRYAGVKTATLTLGTDLPLVSKRVGGEP